MQAINSRLYLTIFNFSLKEITLFFNFSGNKMIEISKKLFTQTLSTNSRHNFFSTTVTARARPAKSHQVSSAQAPPDVDFDALVKCQLEFTRFLGKNELVNFFYSHKKHHFFRN
jgi:hypothetical protein